MLKKPLTQVQITSSILLKHSQILTLKTRTNFTIKIRLSLNPVHKPQIPTLYLP